MNTRRILPRLPRTDISRVEKFTSLTLREQSSARRRPVEKKSETLTIILHRQRGFILLGLKIHEIAVNRLRQWGSSSGLIGSHLPFKIMHFILINQLTQEHQC